MPFSPSNALSNFRPITERLIGSIEDLLCAVRTFAPRSIQLVYCSFLSDELAYRRLYLILTIPLDRYDAFVKKIEISSPAHEVLRKAVFERQIRDDHFERIMNIICNGWEAEIILDLANHVYPDIAPDLARQIARAHESVATLREMKNP